MAVHQPPGKLPYAIHKKPEPDRNITMSRYEYGSTSFDRRLGVRSSGKPVFADLAYWAGRTAVS